MQDMANPQQMAQGQHKNNPYCVAIALQYGLMYIGLYLSFAPQLMQKAA